MTKKTLFVILLGLMAIGMRAQRMQQKMGRGVVAVNRSGSTIRSVTSTAGTGSLISWRKLAEEPEGTTYNVYKRTKGATDYTKVNTKPLKVTCLQTTLANNTEYAVAAVSPDGVEGEKSTPFLYKTQSYPNVWFDFNFDDKVIRRNDYRTKFVWPMDTNGDGEYDAVVCDRLYASAVSEDADNTENTATTSHKIQAYKLDGTLLWTVDMGPNVNICGGQNDMVVAWDINCDGRCEVIIKSSDGTRFWDKANETWGKYAMGSDVPDVDGDGIVDYRPQAVRNRPFYVSVIDGLTGAEIACSELKYSEVTDGSDSYNRTSRPRYMSDGYAAMDGHFCICYLDGIHPSLVMECLDRDADKTHHNYVFTWDYDWSPAVPSVNGDLQSPPPTNWHHSATWSRNDKRPWPAEFHQLRVADVNGDGCDEMIQGGYSVNPHTGWFQSPGIGHGDRYILSDIDPDRPGLEVYAIQQSALLGQLLYDAETAERIKEWYLPSVFDVGRGACMDIDASRKGYELYSFTDDYIYDCKGDQTSYTRLGCGIKTMFEGVWWNGDLQREELSSPGGSGWGTNMMITQVLNKARLVEFSQESSWATHGGTGTRPAFMGDIIGDWREEVILAKQNDDGCTGLVGYTTNMPTTYSIYCLQQDPHYRGDCTTRGYYQHPNTGFYLGGDMPLPPLPPVFTADVRNAMASGKSVMFDLQGDNQSPITIDHSPTMLYLMNPRGHDYVFDGNGTAGTGQLIKSMQGKVTFNCSLNHTGKNIISEGVLSVNGDISGPVELRARGTLGGNVTLKDTITFEGALNYEGCRLMPVPVITFKKSVTLPGNVYLEVMPGNKIVVEGDLTFKGTNYITVNLQSQEAAEYVIAECTGTLTADAKNIKVRGLVGLNYVVEVRDQQIVLVIRGMRDPATGVLWTGIEDGNWDYQTANFSLDGAAVAFVTNDEVIFPDGASQRTVTLTDKMVTNGVRFTHDSGTYTFNGEGGISGTGDLVMDGAGKLVLNATKSDYTGKTILNSGTVTVKNLENKGTTSCFGAGTTIEMGKATLIVNHTNAATDRSVVLTDSAAISIPAGSTATLQSALTGQGVLVKRGTGQLNLNYGGTNGYAGTILEAGTLSQGAWNATLGKAGSKIDVTGNATIIVFNNNSTSAVPSLNNAITVQKGKTLIINGGQRCKVQGSLAGEGTVKIGFPYVRGDFSTNLTNFEGVLNPTSGQFRLPSAMNLQKGTLTLGAGVYAVGVQSQSSTETNLTHKIGALTSTAADAQLSTGTWNVGYLGTNTTFAGIIGQNATLNKYGEGTLTLTGTSTGKVVVNEGAIAGTGIVGSLTVKAGAAILVRGRSTNTLDVLKVSGKVTLNSPVFRMERVSGTWQPGTDYQLFTGAVTLTGTPTFEPAIPCEGYVWDYRSLASEGILRLMQAGDANGDGMVDNADVEVVISHIIGKTPAPFFKAAADVNGDGYVNIVDITMIIDIIRTTSL